MAKILCIAVDNSYVDDSKSAEEVIVIDRRGCYKKGYPVAIHLDSWTPSRNECPPTFIIISCPELTVEVARNYNRSWEQTIDFNVLDSNATNGTYQLEVFGDNTSVSGEAIITKAQVEAFLLRWNVVIDGFTTNSVTFTTALWQALQSEGFWNRDVSSFTFVLDNYESTSGIAYVTVSNLVADKAVDQAKRLIEERGGVVASETATSVTFEIERSDLLDKFKTDIKEKTQGTWCRKQHYFSDAIVDEALAVLDTYDGENVQLTWKGTVELTQAEVLTAINDKLSE